MSQPCRIIDSTVSHAAESLMAIQGTWQDPVRDTQVSALQGVNAWREQHPLRGTGYVVDMLWSRRSTMEAPTIRQAIRQAIAFGNDTDTTAALAGGLVGLRFGISGIPKEWLRDLRGKALVELLFIQAWGGSFLDHTLHG